MKTWPIDLKAASCNSNSFCRCTSERKREPHCLSFQCKHVRKMKSKRTFMAISVSLAVCEREHLLPLQLQLYTDANICNRITKKQSPSCCTSKPALSVIVFLFLRLLSCEVMPLHSVCTINVKMSQWSSFY